MHCMRPRLYSHHILSKCAFFGSIFVFFFLCFLFNMSCLAAEAYNRKILDVLLCRNRLTLQTVFNIFGMATGLHEEKSG